MLEAYNYTKQFSNMVNNQLNPYNMGVALAGRYAVLIVIFIVRDV